MVERMVRLIGGLVIFICLALGAQESPVYVSAYFLWVIFAISLSFFLSGVTGFCLMAAILRKLGVND